MIDYLLIKKIFKKESVLKILFLFMIDVVLNEQIMSNVHDVKKKEVNIAEHI